MTTKYDIYKIIDECRGAQAALDDLVHEVADREASRVNNEGLKEQLEFLNRNGMDDDGVLQYLKEAAE